MTVLEQGLYSYLSTYAGLTALISTRIYPVKMPEGVTFPCMTYQRISTPRVPTMDTSGATGDLTSPRIQFDVWNTALKAGGTGAAGCKAITDQLRAALNGKQGSTGGVTIRSALASEEVATWEAVAQLYRTRSEYIIWIQE